MITLRPLLTISTISQKIGVKWRCLIPRSVGKVAYGPPVLSLLCLSKNSHIKLATHLQALRCWENPLATIITYKQESWLLICFLLQINVCLIDRFNIIYVHTIHGREQTARSVRRSRCLHNWKSNSLCSL